MLVMYSLRISVLSALVLSRLASGVAVKRPSGKKDVILNIVNTHLAPDGFERSK